MRSLYTNNPNFLVAATASKGFLPGVVRNLTGCKFNHVMMLYRCPFWKGWWAIQVDGVGVRPVPVERAWVGVYDFSLFKCGLNLRDVLPLSRTDTVKGYDYSVLRTAKKRLRNVFYNQEDLLCSEFIAKFFRKNGVPRAEELTPPTTTPSDIVDFCNKSVVFKKTSIRNNLSLAFAISYGITSK